MPRGTCTLLPHCSCNALPDVLLFLWHASLLYLLSVEFFAHPEPDFSCNACILVWQFICKAVLLCALLFLLYLS